MKFGVGTGLVPDAKRAFPAPGQPDPGIPQDCLFSPYGRKRGASRKDSPVERPLRPMGISGKKETDQWNKARVIEV